MAALQLTKARYIPEEFVVGTTPSPLANPNPCVLCKVLDAVFVFLNETANIVDAHTDYEIADVDFPDVEGPEVYQISGQANPEGQAEAEEGSSNVDNNIKAEANDTTPVASTKYSPEERVFNWWWLLLKNIPGKFLLILLYYSKFTIFLTLNYMTFRSYT